MEMNEPQLNYQESLKNEYSAYLKGLIDRGYYLRSMYIPNINFAQKVPRKKKIGNDESLYNNGFKDATNNFEIFKDQMDNFELRGDNLKFDVAVQCRKSHLIAFDFDNGGNEFHNSENLASDAGTIAYNTLSNAEGLNNEFDNAIQETTPHGMRVIFSDANFTDEELDKIGERFKIRNIDGLEIMTGGIMIYPSIIYDENGEKQGYKLNNLVNNKNLSNSDVTVMSENLKKIIMYWVNEKEANSEKSYENITSNIGINVSSQDPLYLSILKKGLASADEIIEDAKINGFRNNHFLAYARKLYSLNLPDEEVEKRYWDKWRAFPNTQGSDWNEKAYGATLRSAKKFADRPNFTTLKDWVGTIKAEKESKNTDDPIYKAKRDIKDWLTKNEAKSIPTNVLADIAIKHFDFIHLPNNEGGKLYLYSYDAVNKETYGLYTSDFKEMEKLIYTINPSYSIRYIDETVKKIDLSRSVPVKPLCEDWRKIPVKNCIYDLDTHSTIEFNPKYVFTSKAMTNYDEKYLDPKNEPYKLLKDGSKETVQGFLKTISVKKNGEYDPEINKLLYQVCASAINPRICRKHMIVPYSKKAGSGKSTFEDVIKSLVGAENVSGLTMKKFEGQFALSGLVNKMLNIGDDNSFLPLTDTSNLQATTTGNIVSVEPKGKTAFSTVLHFLNVQSTNKIFRYKNKAGMDSRTLYIPFNARLVDKDRKALKPFDEDWIRSKQGSEPSEWLLANVLRHHSDFINYAKCKASEDVKDEAVKDNDPIRTFAEEEFLPLKIESIPCKAVFSWYKFWCEEVGLRSVYFKRFNGDLDFALQEIAESSDSNVQYVTNPHYYNKESATNTVNKLRIIKHEEVLQLAKKTGTVRCFYKKPQSK